MHLPVTLPLKPSLSLIFALGAAHGLAMLGLFAIGLPLAPKVLAALLLVLSLAWRVHCLIVRPPCRALTLRADGSLALERTDGNHGEAEMLGDTTVLPWLVVLSLRLDGERLSLALPPDSLAGDGHRLLRLWLRWRAVPA